MGKSDEREGMGCQCGLYRNFCWMLMGKAGLKTHGVLFRKVAGGCAHGKRKQESQESTRALALGIG